MDDLETKKGKLAAKKYEVFLKQNLKFVLVAYQKTQSFEQFKSERKERGIGQEDLYALYSKQEVSLKALASILC